MIRGTTPKHIFKLPISTDQISKLRVVYLQSKTVICEKNEKDCEMSGNEVSLTLTQEETLKFKDWLDAKVQIRVLTVSGESLASEVFVVGVGELLKDEVLSNEISS